MRKALFITLLIAAIAILGYFVGYPLIQEQVGKNNGQKDLNLIAANTAADASLLTGEWKEKERITYAAKDYRTLESEFEQHGFPPFQYLEDGEGSYTTKGERSVSEDGTIIELYMDDNYYLKTAKFEYVVPSNRFNSTSMDKNIAPFITFVSIITNHEVDETAKASLIREFTNVFNDSNKEYEHKVEINGLTFELSIDTFFGSIVMTSL